MCKTKAWLFIIGFFCSVQIGRAQFDSQSPSSYYGIGNPTANSLQNGFAMGGVAHALHDSCFINPTNPASYASLDVTQLNFGFEGNFLTRNEYGNSFQNNNLFINQFGIGIPIMHRHKFVNWGMYLGYAPFSQVGYKLTETSQVIINTDTMQATYNYFGNGGLNQITFGNGFQLGKNFSIGVNLHYLFGTSNRVRTLDIPPDKGYLSSRITEKTTVGAFSFDVGMQGFFDFKVWRYARTTDKRDTIRRDKKPKDYQFTIGATYTYGASINAGFDQLGVQYLSGNIDVDTFLLNPSSKGNITMPHAIGGGIALSNKRIWTLSADFNYKFWSGFKYFDQPDLLFNNSYSMHLGMEYTPYFSDRLTAKKGRFYKNVVYRLGARYYNRYYRPDSKPVDEIAFSFGFGLPFGFSKTYDEDKGILTVISYINLGMEAGIANSRGGGLVDESFLRFTLGLSLRDKWFIKRRYN